MERIGSAGLVAENGMSWRCKYKTCVGDTVEMVLPVGSIVEEMEDDMCTNRKSQR